MTRNAIITTTIGLVAGLALAGTAVWAQGNGQGRGPGAGQGAGPMGEQMANFVLEWDMNEDGRVTLEDVTLRRGDLFEMFDTDGDGAIDAAEQVTMAEVIASQEENNRGAHGYGQGQGQGQGQGRQGQGHGQGRQQGHAQGQGQGQGQGRGPGHGQGGGRTSPGQMIHGAMTLAFTDADGDGAISSTEWAEATPRLFAQLDANGDGGVDATDFGRGR